MNSIRKKYLLSDIVLSSAGVLVSYCLLAFCTYLPALFNGFMSDDFTWLEMLAAGPGADLNFNDKFFLPLAHYIQYALLFVTGGNPHLLHIFQLLVHVINAFLLFLLIKHFLRQQNKNVPWLAFAGGLLFLLCPYNSEAVNWFAAMSYPLSVLFLLLSAIAGLKAIETGLNKHIFGFALMYLLSLLCKEISISAILIPVVALVFGLIPKSKQSYKLIISGAVVLIIYFILRTIILGSAIGGYGTEIHTQLSAAGILRTLSAYFAKFFLLYRYLFAGWDINFWIKFSVISASLIIWFAISFKSIATGWKISKNRFIEFMFLASVFVIFCIPVINLEITSLGSIQSDRYSYLISIAFVLILVFILKNINLQVSKAARIVAVISFIILTFATNIIYKQNDLVIKSITESFFEIHQAGKKVVIINIPDTYKGVYTFRHGFVQAIHRADPEFNDPVAIVAWQTTSANSEITFKCDSNSIFVYDKQNPFVKINTDAEFPEIEQAKDNTAFFIWNAGMKDYEYLYYHRGRLHLLRDVISAD